ncbi:MAG: hypothetical protein MJY44_04710 [Bacteroidales bacterium]|nr:hypothetical protein [Bacteroidales bacterium]
MSTSERTVALLVVAFFLGLPVPVSCGKGEIAAGDRKVNMIIDTESGTISINERGRSIFVDDPDGRHYIIAVGPQYNFAFYESLRLLSLYNPNKDGGFSVEVLEPYRR